MKPSYLVENSEDAQRLASCEPWVVVRGSAPATAAARTERRAAGARFGPVRAPDSWPATRPLRTNVARPSSGGEHYCSAKAKEACSHGRLVLSTVIPSGRLSEAV